MYGCMFLVYSFVVSFFFFKQKTAYEMRISDWSSDVCSSDLLVLVARWAGRGLFGGFAHLVDKGFAFVLDRDAAIADRAIDEPLAGKDDGNGDMAIERQLAPFVDRLPLGGQDDVAVEDQPPGANALDDLGHTRRKPHQVAIFLHQRVGDAAFEREAD